MVTINGKNVLQSGDLLFQVGDVLEIAGPVPIRVTANETAPPATHVSMTGPVLNIELNGYSDNDWDKITTVPVTHAGQPFVLLVHASRITPNAPRNIYRVQYQMNPA